jgi:GNAT superfamily N-acetyltransferase/SAM-dependent methyltransferase
MSVTIENYPGPDAAFTAIARAEQGAAVGSIATQRAYFSLEPGFPEEEVAEIVDLHISPDFRGLHLGRQLLRLAADQAGQAPSGARSTIVARVTDGVLPWFVREGFHTMPAYRSIDSRLQADGTETPLQLMVRSTREQSGYYDDPIVAAREVGDSFFALQYEVRANGWKDQEGQGDAPNRRLFLRHLQPFLNGVWDQTVLDVGGGLGWFSDQVLSYGGEAVCLEPSSQLARKGRWLHPEVEYVNAPIELYETDKRFDAAFAIMIENNPDLVGALVKVRQLLKPGGKFTAIIGDFDRTVRGRPDSQVWVRPVAYGEAEVNIQSERFGDLWVISRTPNRYKQLAGLSGLTLVKHTPIKPEPWHPHYEAYKDQPLFHMMEFAA